MAAEARLVLQVLSLGLGAGLLALSALYSAPGLHVKGLPLLNSLLHFAGQPGCGLVLLKEQANELPEQLLSLVSERPIEFVQPGSISLRVHSLAGQTGVLPLAVGGEPAI